MSAYEILFADIAAQGMLPATSVAKLRPLQTNHRASPGLQPYRPRYKPDISPHAQQTTLRERAALVRDPN